MKQNWKRDIVLHDRARDVRLALMAYGRGHNSTLGRGALCTTRVDDVFDELILAHVKLWPALERSLVPLPSRAEFLRTRRELRARDRGDESLVWLVDRIRRIDGTGPEADSLPAFLEGLKTWHRREFQRTKTIRGEEGRREKEFTRAAKKRVRREARRVAEANLSGLVQLRLANMNENDAVFAKVAVTGLRLPR